MVIAVGTVAVTVTDDDTAGVTVSETTLTLAEGGSATYTVVLDAQPASDVLIRIDLNNQDVGVDADATIGQAPRSSCSSPRATGTRRRR